MVAAGRAISGSSKLPARTKIRCGRDFGLAEQGRTANRAKPPMHDVAAVGLGHVVAQPALDGDPSRRKQTFTLPLPVARYWHTRHQHTRATSGLSTLRYATARHRHPPNIAFFVIGRL